MNFVFQEIKKEKNDKEHHTVSSNTGTGGHVAELANKLGKEGIKMGGSTKRQDNKPQGQTSFLFYGVSLPVVQMFLLLKFSVVHAALQKLLR